MYVTIYLPTSIYVKKNYWVAQESAQQEFLFFKYVPKTGFPRLLVFAHITETTQIGNMSSVLSRVTFGPKAGWQSVITVKKLLWSAPRITHSRGGCMPNKSNNIL